MAKGPADADGIAAIDMFVVPTISLLCGVTAQTPKDIFIQHTISFTIVVAFDERSHGADDRVIPDRAVSAPQLWNFIYT
jgi:hypothetical protein